jgi:molybdate transport system substrate-binding protein
LTVFAAASLTDAFNELGRMFEERNPGIEVQFNFAGSQRLAVQLEQGAAADVFASADDRWMNYVQERGLTGEEPQVVAKNRLVVIVPAKNPARLDHVADLARRGVKLVLAAESVPAGKYSREVLRNLCRAPGFGESFAQRVLANVVSEEEDVRSVVTKVQLGEADAGMAYRSDVTLPSVARRVRMLGIPEVHNVLVSYPAAVLKNAGRPDIARAFVEWVRSVEGQEVLRKHGFLPATATRP